MSVYDRTYKGYDGPKTDAKLEADTAAARAGKIYGTPRTYINGHLLAGAAATEILHGADPRADA